MSIRAGFQAVRRGKRLLRLAPFETDTAEGRSLERYRRVALSAVSSGLARFVSAASTLLTIPLLVRYLGPERYGLYATITAIAGLVGFADLGIGNGLVGDVASASARGDRLAVRRASSTAFFFLLGLAVALACVFAVVYRLISWPEVFNIRGRGASEAGLATAFFVAGVLLALPLGIVQRVELGLQEGYVASLWQAAGSILGLAGIGIAVLVGASLPYAVLAVSLAPAAALCANGFHLVRRRRTWMLPTIRLVDRAAGIVLVRLGLLFFVLQTAMAVAFESDAVVLTQILGPGAVTPYSVTMRVFLIVPAVIGFALAPLWPAYGEAIGRGDLRWVERALERSLRLSFVISLPCAGVLLLVARPLIEWWSGVRAPYSLLAAAATWIVLLSSASALSMFLNAARVIKPQIVLALVMMTTNLALSIVLTHAIGVSGVVWGTVIAEGAVVLVPGMFIVNRTLARLRQDQDAWTTAARSGSA